MELLDDHPHTLDIAPIDHWFFFPKLKGKIIGTMIEIEPFKKILDGVTSTLAIDMHVNFFCKLVNCHISMINVLRKINKEVVMHLLNIFISRNSLLYDLTHLVL